MADDIINQVDSTYWKSLRRIPDVHLRGPEGEDKGKVYSAILQDLQIRPEVHEAFFDGNVRPFRNKKENSTLIAKGDDESLLKLSKAYLRAYGNLVWGKDRKWLLGQDQLTDGEPPLRHMMPKDRSEGDHDRFHELLARLFKQMRSIIFELKPALRPNHTYSTFNTADNPSSSTMPTRSGIQYQREKDSPDPEAEAAEQQQITSNQEPPRLRRPYYYEPEPRFEVSVPGYWNASRTEKAILDAITELKWAQRESDPRVFRSLFEQHIARLNEIEQYEDQQSAMSVADQTSGILVPGQDNTVATQMEHMAETDDTERLTMAGPAADTVALSEQQEDEDVTMNDAADPVQSSLTATTTSKNTTTVDRATNTESTIHISHADRYHRSEIPPSFPLTAYLPPILPQIMTVYITRYSHTATTYAQPYIWPDAPVHILSYNAFRDGIRLRAEVPDSVTDEKLTMVFGYGWNDFCCVIGGETSWRNWFIPDMRRAAERSGVRVWRMRVCVVVK